MANTYVAIATVTVGSGGAANITFSSIPATYTDLLLCMSLRSDTATNFDNINLEFNSSSANFSHRKLLGDGATASSTNATNNTFMLAINGATSTTSTFANTQIYIPNYAGSTNKSFSGETASETNAATAYLTILAGLWSNTAAITSIKITSSVAANFVQYSTATLYGIKNS